MPDFKILERMAVEQVILASGYSNETGATKRRDISPALPIENDTNINDDNDHEKKIRLNVSPISSKIKITSSITIRND